MSKWRHVVCPRCLVPWLRPPRDGRRYCPPCKPLRVAELYQEKLRLERKPRADDPVEPFADRP